MLNRAGHSVTVYERAEIAGGLVRVFHTSGPHSFTNVCLSSVVASISWHSESLR